MMKAKAIKLGKSKRGVSPLVATVLLIAFAVALGAVVMNWGKQQVDTHMEELEICKDVSLNWYSLDGKEQICYTESKLKFTVENGVVADVNDLKLIIVGAQDIYIKERTRIGLRKTDLKKTEINYDLAKYGVPQEVRLIPLLLIDEKEVICPSDSGLIKQSPEKCK